MSRLYSEKANELAAVLKRYKSKSKSDVWKGNAQLEKEVEKILLGLDADFKRNLLVNIGSGQNLANDCLDLQTTSYLRGMDLDTKDRERQFYRDLTALTSWKNYRMKGLNLSDRVWKLDEQTKEQMEFFIKEGLAEGRDAPSLARDIKAYLKEPDKRFRRIRNDEGKLVLSAPAKLYKPGQGVYRSSYKNALRVARNEINIAYRYADHERVQTLDFVKGIKVNLSNAHPKYDICDELQGEYPKGFKFLGWHPNCLCFTTTVLMNQKEFINFVNTKARTSKDITTIPARAQKFLNANSDTIKGYKNKPYFIADNFKNTKEGFAIKSHVTK
jgi:hypothetical protein